MTIEIPHCKGPLVDYFIRPYEPIEPGCKTTDGHVTVEGDMFASGHVLCRPVRFVDEIGMRVTFLPKLDAIELHLHAFGFN